MCHMLTLLVKANCMAISIDPSLIKLSGRIFDPSTVLYGSKNADFRGSVKMGGWKLIGQQLTIPSGGKKFALLQITDENSYALDDGPWANAVGYIQDGLSTLGLNHSYHVGAVDDHIADLSKPNRYATKTEEDANEKVIETKLKNLKVENDVSLLFVLLPRKSQEIYAMVKRMGDIKVGIHTICVALKSPKSGLEMASHNSVHWNLALKANMKLGGTNQWLGQTWTKSDVLARSTMFVGIDVTHPSRGSQQGAPSIVGIASTFETHSYSRWVAETGTQFGDRKSCEIVPDLATPLIGRIKDWFTYNERQLPDQIIIYRDGGSEGFFTRILDTEWPQITTAIDTVRTQADQPSWDPAVVLICAIKRNSTRFFPDQGINKNLLGSQGNLQADCSSTAMSPST